MKLLIKIILSTLLVFASIVKAEPATPAEELSRLLNSFNSLSANFQQIVYDAQGNVSDRASGTMALEKPGKFRWNVLHPDKQLYVADGEYLWVYDVNLNQATRQKIDKTQTDSPASLLSGSIADLQAQFTVDYLQRSGPGVWFKLVTKSESDVFKVKAIELHFVDNVLANMDLYDNLGQFTKFSFNQTKMNPALSPALFKFVPPKGVDIVKGEN